ncbi:hypothetical protein BgiMline_003747, partial [Biomphalaria glabrata]
MGKIGLSFHTHTVKLVAIEDDPKSTPSGHQMTSEATRVEPHDWGDFFHNIWTSAFCSHVERS